MTNMLNVDLNGNVIISHLIFHAFIKILLYTKQLIKKSSKFCDEGNMYWRISNAFVVMPHLLENVRFPPYLNWELGPKCMSVYLVLLGYPVHLVPLVLFSFIM